MQKKSILITLMAQSPLVEWIKECQLQVQHLQSIVAELRYDPKLDFSR